MPPRTLSSGEAFVWLDRRLDGAQSGPTYLRRPEIAQLVVASIHKGVRLGHYDLGAYVIMANHVHLLIQPKIAPHRLLKSLKGASARAANRLLAQTGEPFWQKESYDHWVRDQMEFDRIRGYIEWNPVKAGLVSRPEDYPWSSAYGPAASVCAEGVETSLDRARTSPCATNKQLR